MSERFLLYFPDPFGARKSVYVLYDGENVTQIDASAVAALEGEIISYDVGTLIDDLRTATASPPKLVVDIAEAIRLGTGLSKSDGGERKWGYWRNLRKHFESEEDWRQANAIHDSRSMPPDGAERTRLFRSIGRATKFLWHETVIDLRRKTEASRFFEIEVPAAQVFYKRQSLGIKIDSIAANRCLEDASKAKYTAYLNVAKILDVSPTGLNYWNVSEFLYNTDVPKIEDVAKGYSLRDQLKLSRDVSVFSAVFTEYMDAARDVDVITRLVGSPGRVFPTFHPFGTISSRVLVSDPHLQELSRKYRAVVSAEPGLSLRYFDYSQFEPGIMASIANDPDLIKMYNEGDVYTSLSHALFRTADQRDLCKKIFLAFSYGMNSRGIAGLISGQNDKGWTSSDVQNNVDAFFERFSRLSQFKIELESQLQHSGFVSSLQGNRRIRKEPGTLSARERRWAVSQVVQGTASLIFKKAIIGLAKELSSDAILLPMHDAVLVQLPENSDLDNKSESVTEIMKRSFKEVCPSVTPRVTSGTFAPATN